MKTKLLLYCTKAKPYLYKTEDTTYPAYPIGYHTDKDLKLKLSNTNELAYLNGKIVAECDFEVEEIKKINYDCLLFTNTLNTESLINKSCIDYFELEEYLKPNWDKEDDLQNLHTVGYAIHIKNLHIFDEPRDITKLVLINQYRNDLKGTQYNRVKVAPQNMCMVDYAIDCNYKENIFDSPYILISIRPEWLCKILNREKTIEVRKKVLKEMLNNE